ncbi:MFS transporter [Corynebacterium comes]|uniref:Proline/betaine transporter n=1 Tax=Corynebacterium comes TaxID=2675218 RepID=A0A6B8VX24_9CORY|nr:MFS transporter [Corynebacterium comes]QGU05884.1 Proline/betaine transporter [Corynebacterium comes]
MHENSREVRHDNAAATAVLAPQKYGANPTLSAGDSTHYNKTLARKATFAGGVGTLIEYYELSVYAFLALIIGPLFFPSANPTVSTIATLGVFASSFLMRPIGGWFFGHVGDKYGRKVALLGSVGLMSMACLLMGMLPTFAQIGVFATMAIILLRLAQGFAAGGEIGGSATYIAETAPPGKRGKYGSATAIGATLGFAVASATVGLTQLALTDEQMVAFGWRIPFLLSVVLAAIALWGRMHIEESSDFKKLGEKSMEVEKSPIIAVIKAHPGQILRLVGLSIALNGTVYIGLTYFVIYLQMEGFNATGVSWVAAVSIAAATLFYPFIGSLSDRFGRRAVLLGGYIGFALLAIPTFYVMSTTSSFLVVAVFYCAFMIFSGASQVPTWALAAELFPVKVRFTGIALGYNIGTIVAGGTAPLVATYLVQTTGSSIAPAGWVILVSIIGIISVATIKRRDNVPLPTTKEELVSVG